MLKLFKAKCPWCDEVLPKSPAIVIIESKDGKHEVEICDGCAEIYEKLASEEEDTEND